MGDFPLLGTIVVYFFLCVPYLLYWLFWFACASYWLSTSAAHLVKVFIGSLVLILFMMRSTVIPSITIYSMSLYLYNIVCSLLISLIRLFYLSVPPFASLSYNLLTIILEIRLCDSFNSDMLNSSYRNTSISALFRPSTAPPISVPLLWFPFVYECYNFLKTRS